MEFIKVCRSLQLSFPIFTNTIILRFMYSDRRIIQLQSS